MSFEKTHVKNVYDVIANHFDATRYNVWIDVKNFINSIPKNSFILDAGCGNGKNMYRRDCHFIGSDFCNNFLEISKKYTKQLVMCNIKNLPFKDNMFDYVISVAVIHHIYDKKDRINAIKELVRVTNKNGKILISAWCAHGNYKEGDNMIKWQLQDKYNKTEKEVYDRYYYLYKKNELLEDIQINISNVNIDYTVYNFNNSFIVLSKK